jgi:signal peptidase I
LLVFRALAVEPYEVPTGSMAPALVGNHRAVECPCCGYPVVVGRHRADHGRGSPGPYRGVACPNCGCTDLGLDQVPECAGDHLLVNKFVFDLRRPRRWEMIVFRGPSGSGKAYVKRVVGLPGETVEVRHGDVYIDHDLARKTLAEFKAVRIPVFDNNYQPKPAGWRDRWLVQPPREDPPAVVGTELHLDAERVTRGYQWLTYRHRPLGKSKSQPIMDEYGYNGDEPRAAPAPDRYGNSREDPRAQAAVHDFMLECDVEVVSGEGWLLLGITDGLDELHAELPVGAGPEQRGEGCARLQEATATGAGKTYRRAPGYHLSAGKAYHLELAFVDRRATLAVDGALPFAPTDLPAAERRPPVEQPARLGARGVTAVVRNFRLFRDIHYTQAGDNAVRGRIVPLGAGEYFVLGDNSPNSDDSRFWPNRGVVAEANLLGKPFLVHLPSRVVRWDGLGGHYSYQGPDWGRVRWLR